MSERISKTKIKELLRSLEKSSMTRYCQLPFDEMEYKMLGYKQALKDIMEGLALNERRDTD